MKNENEDLNRNRVCGLCEMILLRSKERGTRGISRIINPQKDFLERGTEKSGINAPKCIISTPKAHKLQCCKTFYDIVFNLLSVQNLIS